MKRSRTDFSLCRTNVCQTKGFTLVEVVITLTVLGFILLMVYGAFRLGLSSWERGDSAKDEYQRVRVVSQLISRQIKSVVPYKIKTSKAEGDYLAFEGKANSLRFVSALPMKGGRPEGFVYAVYAFKEGGREGSRLILYEQKALNKDFFDEALNEELETTLLNGVTEVKFEYYREENKDNNQKEEWVEEWNAKEEKELPKALRMTLTVKDEKGKAEAIPVVLLASISATQPVVIRSGPLVPGRRATQERPQTQGY